MPPSSVEEAFDAAFESGDMAPGVLDGITDDLAACATDGARESMMRTLLDSLFFQPGTLNHQIHGLTARAELNGSAVEF